MGRPKPPTATESRPMGRGTKRTPENREKIIGFLRMGVTQKDAAAASGMSHETFYAWRNDDSDFSEAVLEAEAECAAKAAARFTKAATESEGDWKAAESWLKRRRPDEWGDQLSIRADREAQALIAALFPENATTTD